MRIGTEKAFNIILAFNILGCLMMIVVGVLFETGTFSITAETKEVTIVVVTF